MTPQDPPFPTDDGLRQQLAEIYRADSRRVLATLIRLLGDFDLAEEALGDAFAAAMEQWPTEGVPANPRAWLVSAGRFKAIDTLRRRARFEAAQGDVARALERNLYDPEPADGAGLADDRLRLIFTCCHPALPPESRVALTLREVCGLTTEEIARAFLLPAPTLAQRIVRAKSKIKEARIPYQVPERAELAGRLDGVLQAIYLVFNEGYSASSGPSLTRADLSGEAIRLGRLLADLLPEPEVLGLLALMLLSESRRRARATPAGDLVLLADQDRALWNHDLIGEAKTLVARALAAGAAGPGGRQVPGGRQPGSGGPGGAYTLQAAISAVHAEAPSADATDWPRIIGLYDLLLQAAPSPVVALNRAVAVAMRDGPRAGLLLVDALLPALDQYHLAHAARADLCRRLGFYKEAREAYEKALSLTQQGPERRFLEGRLAALPA